MKDLLKIFISRTSLPSILLYMRILNLKSKILHLFKLDKIYTNTTFNHKKVVLIAIYKNGSLRKDIKNLLDRLQKKGYYVIGVNTLKLSKSEIGSFDKLIVRNNYGRDFGSYKRGFKYFYNNIAKKSKDVEKLLMLNDSIFYSLNNDNLDKFIDNLSDNRYELIGATENFEISHHIGSFCMSFSSEILFNKKFMDYWKNYKLSDIRPTVIKRGELGLSKIAFKCLTGLEKVNVLYGIDKFLEHIDTNNDVVDNFYMLSRKSDLVGWTKPSYKLLHKQITDDFFSKSDSLVSKGNVKFEGALEDIDTDHITNNEQYYDYVKNTNITKDKIKLNIITMLTSSYVIGSQIHQNYGFIYRMGCPILKNDALYRGMVSFKDITYLKEILNKEDHDLYVKILVKQQYGDNVLIGWKNIAFNNGYL